MKKIRVSKKRTVKIAIKSAFWFFTGAVIGLFFFASFTFILFQKYYADKIFPGITIDRVEFGGKTKDEIAGYFAGKNKRIQDTNLVFTFGTDAATTSAKTMQLGYNSTLLAQQAYSIGRSNDTISNISIALQAYLYGINLPPSYQYAPNMLDTTIDSLVKKATIEPIEALFQFENGRVKIFRPSSNGQRVNTDHLKNRLSAQIPALLAVGKQQTIVFSLPIEKVLPKISTDQANNLGIKELIGSGTSLFQHSIPNRIYNITLGTSRINGVLVKPGETFSFVKALGDVSAFTGYKQAYVIQNGQTVLGDGGGICQVSTTFFRALLNAGLPIVERHAHAYRVGYYEQDSPPGLDATVYVPSVDLRFKNDTKHYILIQASQDLDNQSLTFYLYGTKDNRQVTISKPIITNQIPAPAPKYQDDPTLAIGVEKQVDFEASGAKSVFTRQVIRSGKTILNDTFVSNYRPWQAVYLRGTKE